MIAFDFETHLITPGNLTPKPVCMSWASDLVTELCTAEEGLDTLENFLTHNQVLVGANVAFDFGVACAARPSLMPLVFEKYRRNQVFDVQIAASMDNVAHGTHISQPSLEDCVAQYLGRTDAKQNDTWRLRYAELDGIPLSEWPEEARQYPIDDAENTLAVARQQLKVCKNLEHMSLNAKAAWSLHLASCHGIRTDGQAVEKLEQWLIEQRKARVEKFQAFGLYGPDGEKVPTALKRRVILATGGSEDVKCGHCAGAGVVPGKSKTITTKCKTCKGRAFLRLVECDGGASWIAPKKSEFRESLAADYQTQCPACTDGTASREKEGEPVQCKPCGATGLEPGEHTPKSPADGISTSSDSLQNTGDEVLLDYCDGSELEKIYTTYLPFLKSGTETPINVRANVLLNTGRTSYSGLLQTFPRNGGVRECIVPPDGRVLCSVDYSALEMCTLAQVNTALGHEPVVMRDVINQSGDAGKLHSALGAEMMNIPFEEMERLIAAKDETAKGQRQGAKAGNFGIPGGMGGATMVVAKRVAERFSFCVTMLVNDKCKPLRAYQVGSGDKKHTKWACPDCVEIAIEIKEKFEAKWKEMPKYFNWVSKIPNLKQGRGVMKSPITGFIRGGLNYSSAANHPFQHLAAWGAKRALNKVTHACYVDKSSPLYGSRVVLFIHDEIVIDTPEATAHEAGHELSRLMVECMQVECPHVTIKAEPALMRRLSKNAETIYRNGRLIPWEDK